MAHQDTLRIQRIEKARQVIEIQINDQRSNLKNLDVLLIPQNIQKFVSHMRAHIDVLRAMNHQLFGYDGLNLSSLDRMKVANAIDALEKGIKSAEQAHHMAVQNAVASAMDSLEQLDSRLQGLLPATPAAKVPTTPLQEEPKPEPKDDIVFRPVKIVKLPWWLPFEIDISALIQRIRKLFRR